MKNKIDWESAFGIMMLVLMVVVIGTSLFLTGYCFAVYGDKPITEVPMWALWFMGK